MPITVEDVVEAAATGVLRALDARKKAGQKAPAEPADTLGLIRSGFFVSVAIRCGGFPGPLMEDLRLNPQPLPPVIKE
jgi:hypothetical protein